MKMQRHSHSLSLFFLTLWLAACQPEPPQDPDQPMRGLWRGEIDLYGTWIPFNFEIQDGTDLRVDSDGGLDSRGLASGQPV